MVNGILSRRRRLIAHWLPVMALAFAWLGVAHGAHGYIGQNPYSVHLDGPADPVMCNADVSIRAVVRDAETGALVAGQIVVWDVRDSLSPDDSVSPTATVTNTKGRTRVTLRFGPVEGPRTVRATIAQWPATIRVTCQGGVPVKPPPTTPASPSPAPTNAPQPTPSGSTPLPPTPTDAGPATPAGSSPSASAPATFGPGAVSPGPGTATPGPGTATPGPGGVTPGSGGTLDLAPIVAIALVSLGLGSLGLVTLKRR